MEKLIELLNEYEKDKYGFSSDYFELEIDDETGEPTGGIIDSSEDYFEVTSYYITMKIISKRFGFIKRLVKNDKIEYQTFGNAFGTKYLESPVGSGNHEKISDYLDIIKLLAVSDTPIKDLVSYLK